MKKFLIFVMCCMTVLTMSGCRMIRNVVMSHEREGRYDVMRINSDTNRYKSKTDYFYNVEDFVYRYSLKENKTEKYMDLEDYYISYYAVWNEWIYYVKKHVPRQELLKLNYNTGEEEQILSNEQLSLTENDLFVVDVYADYLFFRINEQVYMCPANGDIKSDSFDVNILFTEEDTSGQEQKAVFHGIVIKRAFDEEYGDYRIKDIREEATNARILYGEEQSVLMGGKKVIFRHSNEDKRDFLYSMEGEEEHVITCLQKESYKYSDIYEERLTVENDEIIGLISVSQHTRVSINLFQDNIEQDILFKLNPATAESSVICKTKNNQTRIIGYKDGIVYLMKDYAVYSQPLEGGKKTELFRLPENPYYIFDWQAGYLIVRYDDDANQNYDIAATYKVN